MDETSEPNEDGKAKNEETIGIDSPKEFGVTGAIESEEAETLSPHVRMLADDQTLMPDDVTVLDEGLGETVIPDQLGVGTAQPQRPGAGPTITDTRRSPAGPQRFGKFELLAELGRGGMGVVYKARQHDPERLVALKMILSGSHAGGVFRRRFEIEAEVVGNLRHPNIVSLYEAGEQDGNLYYTMPLIEGTTLSDSVANETWTLRESVELMLKLAQAIAHAHQRGVLHRDLKPSNILLDKNRQPYITDFGLAKMTDSEKGDMTMTGDVMGSPGYMAPEQASGRTHQISTATDVYGLGVILYQMLSGDPPFHAETIAELLQLVIHEEPSRPASKIRKVDRDLSTICLKCLEKDPTRRYVSADALADDLQRWLNGEPIQARPVGVPMRVLKWTRRNPTLTALILVTVTLSTIAVVGIARKQRQYFRQVVALKTQQAEDELLKGNAGRSLARWSDILRLKPDEDYARRRINELLENRNFARSIGPVYRSAMAVRFHALSATNGLAFISPEQGPGRIVRVREGADLELATGALWSAEFSGDGKWLVTSSPRSGVKIWDTDTGIILKAIPDARQAGVLATNDLGLVAISPDRTRLATASVGNGALIWNMESGERHRLQGDAGSIIRNPKKIGFDPTGRWLAIADGSRLIVWDAQAMELLFEHRDPRFVITDFDFSQRGKRLVAASNYRRVRVWELGEDGEPDFELDHGASVGMVAFRNDAHEGRFLASAGHDKQAAIWDLKFNARRNDLAHRAWVRRVAFNDSGKRLLTVSSDRRLRVWDVSHGVEFSEWIPHPDDILEAQFDGRDQLVVLCKDGSIHRWDIGITRRAFETFHYSRQVDFNPTGGEFLVIGSHDHRGVYGWRISDGRQTIDLDTGWTVSRAMFSPDGQSILAFSSVEQAAKIWQRSGSGVWEDKPYSIKSPNGGTISSARFLPGNDQVMISYGSPRSGGKGGLTRWPSKPESAAATNRVLQPVGEELTAPARYPRPLAFRSDGKLGAFGTVHGAFIFEVESHQILHSLEHRRSFTSWMEFSSDGKLLASSTTDGRARIWNVATGQLLAVLEHRAAVHCVRFNPPGSIVATASADETAQLWDVATGTRIGDPFVHDALVSWVAFSPNGKTVVTASHDKTARMWDVATGRPISSPLVHGGEVKHLDFSADGRWFATACEDGLTRLWKADHARSSEPSENLITAAERAGGYVMDPETGRISLYRHP